MKRPDHWTSQMTIRLGPSGWEIVPMAAIETPVVPLPTESQQTALAQRAMEHLRGDPTRFLREGDALPTISVSRWPGPSRPVHVGTIPTCLFQRDPGNDIGTEALLLRNLGMQDVYIGSLEDLHQDTRSGLLLRGGDARTGRPHELYLASPPPLIFGVTQSSNTTVMVVPF